MRALTGAGVTLEPQVEAHAAELYAVIGDPELYAFTDDKQPVSEAALRERLARLESRQSPDGAQHWLNWVVRNEDGVVVGYVQATVHGTEAEIAYVLGREHWRLGYGFAACTAMLGELAAGYGVTLVTARLDPQNAASLALLRKLGLGLIAEDAAEEVTYARDLRRSY